MRDVYLWTAYVLGAIVLAVVLVALYRRCVDWYDRHSYVPPVYAGIDLPPARASLEDPTQLLRFVGRAAVRPRLTLSSLALLVDFIAREAAIQRAIAYELTPSPIWAEIHGRRHVQGLAVA